MLGEVISTAGPNHMNCCDSYNFMAKFNLSSPLSNVFKIMCKVSQNYGSEEDKYGLHTNLKQLSINFWPQNDKPSNWKALQYFKTP